MSQLPAVQRTGRKHAQAAGNGRRRPAAAAQTKIDLAIDRKSLKNLRLVVVAYSHVERGWFPTEEAYRAELEVESRAQQVVETLAELGVPAKSYPGDQYFFTNLLVDRPNLVLNLVDTLRGKDSLQISVPAALELAEIPYTGAGMQGLVIGNDRNLVKQLMVANEIPTPPFQYIRRRGTAIDPSLGLPLMVKLNESGGSVGIDNHAVKATLKAASDKVNAMIGTYKVPVVVERFVDGEEVTVIAFEDEKKTHILMAQKEFHFKPDGKHLFTSLESYAVKDSYTYRLVEDDELAGKIERYAVRAFDVLKNKDYAKFDIRVDAETRVPYFTDANPNTAFGPSKGLPFTEVLDVFGLSFQEILASLLSKYARKIKS
jgi:D-alanine-D-alanine ligase